jgi:hypothetical protein
MYTIIVLETPICIHKDRCPTPSIPPPPLLMACRAVHGLQGKFKFCHTFERAPIRPCKLPYTFCVATYVEKYLLGVWGEFGIMLFFEQRSTAELYSCSQG